MFSLCGNCGICALNYKETESHPERISYVKLFINKSDWEGINCLSKLDDWKKL